MKGIYGNYVSCHADCSQCLKGFGAVCQARTTGWWKRLQVHQVSVLKLRKLWGRTANKKQVFFVFLSKNMLLFFSGAKEWWQPQRDLQFIVVAMCWLFHSNDLQTSVVAKSQRYYSLHEQLALHRTRRPMWFNCEMNLFLLTGCKVSRVLGHAALYVSVPRGVPGLWAVRGAGPLWIQLPCWTLLLLCQGNWHCHKQPNYNVKPTSSNNNKTMLCLAGKQWAVVSDEWLLCVRQWH